MEQTTADSLREIADFIEAHPEFEGAFAQRLLHFVSDPTEFAAAVTALGGKRDKSTTGSDDQYFGVSRWFGDIELFVYTNRETVCEKVQTGTRTVQVSKDVCPKCQGLVELTPSGALVCREYGSMHFRADPPAQVVETIVEPVYEWECAESILKGVTR